MSQTIFITGTSSGLGRATALYFAAQGWKVAATMRRPEKETELIQHPNIRIFRLDVTDTEQVQAAARQAIEAFGKIDVVINNAGMGTFGPLEFAEEAAIDWQFAVNVRGPINVIRVFLPHFRANKGGMFINISSVMGVATGAPIASLYNMSKFALEGLTEALYYELNPLNIRLHLIEQGGSTGNNFADNITWNTHEEIRDYDRIIAKAQERMNSTDPSLRDDPQTIVDAVYACATGTNKQFRQLVGKMSHDLVAMRKALPIEQYLETIAASFA